MTLWPSSASSSSAAAFLLLLVLGVVAIGSVQAQSNPLINQPQCGFDATTNQQLTTITIGDSERGNFKRTYETICEPLNDDGSTVFLTTTSTKPTFTTFCNLLAKSSNNDIRNYIASGRNQHTLFAPTDSAFASTFSTTTTAAATSLAALTPAQERMILAMHIVPGKPLLTQDLVCDGFLSTLWDTSLFPFQNSTTTTTTTTTATTYPYPYPYSYSYSYPYEYDTFRRRSAATTKTKCLAGGRTAQIGRGNNAITGQIQTQTQTQTARLPIIGSPQNVFNYLMFARPQPTGYVLSLDTVNNLVNGMSRDVVACNGVVQIVDHVLLPAGVVAPPNYYYNGKSGKSGKGAKGYRTNTAVSFYDTKSAKKGKSYKKAHYSSSYYYGSSNYYFVDPLPSDSPVLSPKSAKSATTATKNSKSDKSNKNSNSNSNSNSQPTPPPTTVFGTVPPPVMQTTSSAAHDFYFGITSGDYFGIGSPSTTNSNSNGNNNYYYYYKSGKTPKEGKSGKRQRQRQRQRRELAEFDQFRFVHETENDNLAEAEQKKEARRKRKQRLLELLVNKNNDINDNDMGNSH